MNDVVDRILDMLGHEQVLPNHVTPNMDKAHHWHYRILPSYYDEEFDRRRSAGRNPTYDMTFPLLHFFAPRRAAVRS
jgi:hypothetical protein